MAGFTLSFGVDVQDKLGNIVTTDSSNVTVSIASAPVGVTLGPVATYHASSGVASFTNIYLTVPGQLHPHSHRRRPHRRHQPNHHYQRL